jgi:hypothetical protein
MATTEITTDIRTDAEKTFSIIDFGKFLKNLLGMAVMAGAILSFAYLIWGAIDWLMSEGDTEKLKNAKNKITHALVGLALLAVVWVIWRLALYFLGVGTLTDQGVNLRLGTPD